MRGRKPYATGTKEATRRSGWSFYQAIENDRLQETPKEVLRSPLWSKSRRIATGGLGDEAQWLVVASGSLGMGRRLLGGYPDQTVVCREDTMEQKDRGVVPRFVVDASLGRLARWLRVLGFDTLYPFPQWREGGMPLGVEGRLLITRASGLAGRHTPSILLHALGVGDCLKELEARGLIRASHCRCFSRCLLCNAPLVLMCPEDAQDRVPDHVYHQYRGRIRLCPSCRRLYWPGTHSAGMRAQCRAWGLALPLAEDPALGEDPVPPS